MRKNYGFSLIEVVIVVVVIGVIGTLGVVGYNAWKKNGATQQAGTSTTATTPNKLAVQVPDVKSTNDLDTIAKTLDTTNLNAAGSDSQQLSTQASGF